MATQHRVYLSDNDRAKLKAILSSGSALARTQTKARILLLTDRNRADRLTDDQIIATIGASNSNIQRTRISFLANGLEGCLKDKPRSGRKPKFAGDIQAKLTVVACSKPPEGRCKWTLQLLANKMVLLGHVDTISKVTIHKLLKKTNLSLGR
jgi:putative transposase